MAYTIDGLWNAGLNLDNEDLKSAALLPARVLATDFLTRGILSGRYSNWTGSEAFIPTASAAFAIVWESMFEATGEAMWQKAYLQMNRLLCVIARRGAREGADSLGALPGSFPSGVGMNRSDSPIGQLNILDSLLNER